MSNSSVFKSRLKVLRSSADLQSYDSEFETEGALTQNAFADNVIVRNNRGTANSSLSVDCMLTYKIQRNNRALINNGRGTKNRKRSVN